LEVVILQIFKVSVCISTRNRAEYLKTSIKSALRQTLPNIEIVVLDDCSTDNTNDIVKQFDDPRIVYFRTNERLGVTSSWNKCASISRGEYITFLNDDDALHPEMLEQESKLLDEDPELACVYSGFYVINNNDKIIRTNIPHAGLYVKNGKDEFLSHIIKNYICTQTVLIRRSVFNKLNGFDTSMYLCTDLDFWFRLELENYKIGYINRPLAYIRHHGKTFTSKSILNGSILREYTNVLRKTLLSTKMKKLYKSEEITLIRKNAARGIVYHLLRWSYECLRQGNLKGTAYYLFQLTPWRSTDFGELNPAMAVIIRQFILNSFQLLTGKIFKRLSV